MVAEAPPIGELEIRRPYPERLGPKGNLIYKLITTTDHKLIGIMYCVVCFAFFLIGGLMALFMRTELATPGLQFLSNEQFNQLFTMHGTVMLLFYATPIVFGFANLVLPLQIGAPDVAFPRLNAFSFWLFLFGALIATAGFITPGGAADFGWTAYSPLTDASTLTSHLLARGLIRPFRNGDYHPSGIDIDAAMHPIGADGTARPDIWVLGYPAEGPHFYTHALPRPHIPSRQTEDAQRCILEMLSDIARQTTGASARTLQAADRPAP